MILMSQFCLRLSISGRVVRILLIFPAMILNHMLLIIIWYFFYNYFWPLLLPRPHSPGLGLVALASASKFWPRLTSLISYVIIEDYSAVSEIGHPLQ